LSSVQASIDERALRHRQRDVRPSSIAGTHQILSPPVAPYNIPPKKKLNAITTFFPSPSHVSSSKHPAKARRSAIVSFRHGARTAPPDTGSIQSYLHRFRDQQHTLIERGKVSTYRWYQVFAYRVTNRRTRRAAAAAFGPVFTALRMAWRRPPCFLPCFCFLVRVEDGH
jgi:hypothetical protein